MQLFPFSYQLATINSAAQVLGELFKTYDVIALKAPMGAGKTTLVAALAKHLGALDHVTSPTFSIMNQYKLGNGEALWHMDWYRIGSEDEAIDAGIEDTLFSGDKCIVEWPELFPRLLPSKTVFVGIKVGDDGLRTLDLLKE